MARSPKPSSGNGEPLERLKALYEFMTKHGLEVLELEDGDGRARLVRRGAAQPAAVVVTADPAAMGQGPSSPKGDAPPLPQGTHAAPTLPAGATTIKSPMMGIFYRAPTPSSPPFVKDGDQLAEGQVLCMIEAMKVFNEIKVEYPCTVLRILVENGKPVKSGQDLYAVRRG